MQFWTLYKNESYRRYFTKYSAKLFSWKMESFIETNILNKNTKGIFK